MFLTEGTLRKIKIGKRTIKFKKTTPKNLLTKGKISRVVIQAMKEIGNGRVRNAEKQKILELLKKENEKDLKYDIALTPVWIKEIMKKALSEGNN